MRAIAFGMNSLAITIFRFSPCPLTNSAPLVNEGVSEELKAADQMTWVRAMRLLEEFWYGNIEPTEYDTSSKEYKKLQELICRNEEKLKAAMTDEQKELFEKYTDCVREYQTITDCLIFQNSFKLGARMMLEVMGDN